MQRRWMLSQTMTQSSSQHRIGIYIPDQCSLLTLGAITEPFAHVNQILGEDKYQLLYVGDNAGVQITLTNLPSPLVTNAQIGIEDISSLDTVIIIAEHPAKLLHLPTITQALPSDQLINCSSHPESLNSVLSYLAKYEDAVTVRAISNEYCLDTNNQPAEEATTELPPRLQKAISLMENNLEEPLSAEMIADLVHVSRRQLERLFKRYLDTMPARYYLQLRLKNAQQLLQTTNHSVVQIGLMCGFSSGPHFSSAYKQFFEITPREERAKRFYSAG